MFVALALDWLQDRAIYIESLADFTLVSANHLLLHFLSHNGGGFASVTGQDNTSIGFPLTTVHT